MDEKKLIEKFQELEQDEKFMESVVLSDNYKVFAEKLATKGIQLTDEEAEKLYDGMKNNNDELSEESLEAVSGGVSWLTLAIANILNILIRYYRKHR